jgi:glycosyltransferase involved in cell wall biosynthesis
LVKAFEKIAYKVDFDIVLVGNPKGRYYKKVANAVENSIYRHRIHTLSHLSASEIKWLYENALFSIYPSHYEGFGIPVLESIAHNCPLLASKIKSTEEISNNIPLFFNPNSTDDLAEKMEYIYMNLDAFKTKTQTHRIEILEKYSDKKIADSLYNRYSQLLSQ